MKRNFFTTEFSNSQGIDKQMPKVLKYIVENKPSIIDPELMKQYALSVRNILRSPMAEMFDRIIGNDGMDIFIPMFIEGKQSAMPELIATTNITLDLKQYEGNSILNSMPTLKDKIFVNVSSVLKLDRSRGGLQVSAIDNMQGMFTRGYFVASYEDSDGWLNPNLADFVIQSYGTILSGLISRYYSLSLMETNVVNGILSLAMAQRLSPEKSSTELPPLFLRCKYLGNHSDIENIAESCNEYTSKGLLSSSDISALISKLGPERLNKFGNSAIEFNTLCGSLGPDMITSRIALEYPPYWLYLLVLALSGAKIPMIFQLNNNNLALTGKTKFLQQLLTNDSFFNVRR